MFDRGVVGAREGPVCVERVEAGVGVAEDFTARRGAEGLVTVGSAEGLGSWSSLRVCSFRL